MATTSISAAECGEQDHANEKTTNVSPRGDTSGRGVGDSESTRSGKKLHKESDAEDDRGGNFDNLPEKEYRDQRGDASKGVERKLGAQDARDGSARADAWNFDVVVDSGVDEPSSEAGQ